jgi:MMPL family
VNPRGDVDLSTPAKPNRKTGTRAKAAGKLATRSPRRRAPKKTDTAGLTPEAAQETDRRRATARRAEQVALLAVALICALLALAVEAFAYISVVLMSVLLGLMASNLRSTRVRGGVIAEVVVEAKSLRADILSSGADDSGDAENAET